MVEDMVFHAPETTDFIEFRTEEITPEMAFHTVLITLEIADMTVSMTDLTAFHMVSNVERIPSKIGVRKETMPFQMAEI